MLVDLVARFTQSDVIRIVLGGQNRLIGVRCSGLLSLLRNVREVLQRLQDAFLDHLSAFEVFQCQNSSMRVLSRCRRTSLNDLIDLLLLLNSPINDLRHL